MKNLFDISLKELKSKFDLEFKNNRSIFLSDKIKTLIDVYDLYYWKYTNKIWAFPGIGIIIFPTFLKEPIYFYLETNKDDINYYLFIKDFYLNNNYLKYDIHKIIRNYRKDFDAIIENQLNMNNFDIK